MWWIPLIQAGVSILQSQMQERAMDKARDQQNRINAYAPLLGTTPKALEPYSPQSNMLGNLIGSLTTGFDQYQKIKAQDALNEGAKRAAVINPYTVTPAETGPYNLGVNYKSIL